MTERPEPIRFPTLPVLGAGALVIVALVVAASARIWEVGTTRLSYAEATVTRDLRFEDRPDGSIAVLAVPDGRLIEVMHPGSDGFVRIVMRGLARDRQETGAGPEMPFTLTRWSNGRLTISDPVTTRRVELTGFGKDNVNAFAKLLLAGSDAK